MEDGGIPDDPQVFEDINDWNAHGSSLILENGFGRKDGESDEEHLNAYFEISSDWAMPDEELSEEQRELKAGREDSMRHENLVLRMWECELIGKVDRRTPVERLTDQCLSAEICPVCKNQPYRRRFGIGMCLCPCPGCGKVTREERDPEYRLPSGRLGWKDRLQHVYDDDRDQFEAYDQIYNLAGRLGFESAAAAWDANPLICGSTNPDDYGLVTPEYDNHEDTEQHA